MAELPHLITPIPGPKSVQRVDVLAQHECPAVTARRARRAATLGSAADDPIVWERAQGANVWDADGNRFVDLTSGFGVAFVGHQHPNVVEAVREQAGQLAHAMGDAYPDVQRIRLLARLAKFAGHELSVALLGLSGSDAVDAAVKTAHLATGRAGVLAFRGGYHGLASGVLPLQGYKAAFSEPFVGALHPAVTHLPWGASLDEIRDRLAVGDIGLVLAEPVQGRGGMRAAPSGWLAEVAEATRAHGALFALDEIQSGMGRTGSRFAFEQEDVRPDLLCVGKALGGGYPLSACLGTPEAMNAWGASKGEALHTQTFLGHPVGCAAALATLEVIEREGLVQRAKALGDYFRDRLAQQGIPTRGRGLMLGIELPDTLALSRALLRRGFIVLPAGQKAEVLGLTPPAVMTTAQVDAFLGALADARSELGHA